MLVEEKPTLMEMDEIPIEICFRLSAVEHMVRSILDQLNNFTSTHLTDRQVIENLKLVVKCLLQTRSCIISRFNNINFQDSKRGSFSAEFESRMRIAGLPPEIVAEGETVATIDVSNALETTEIQNQLVFVEFEAQDDWKPVKQEEQTNETLVECIVEGDEVGEVEAEEYSDWLQESQDYEEDEPHHDAEDRDWLPLHKSSVNKSDRRECVFCAKMVTVKSYNKHLLMHQEQETEGKETLTEEADSNCVGGVKSVRRSRNQIPPDEMKFSCSECGKSFAKKINLRLHKRIHAPRERANCPTCGKGYVCSSGLKAHVARGGCVGAAENSNQSETTQACKICGKVVKNESYLRFHMKVHSDEKPYSCEVCGESFRRPCEVNKHKIQRHERPECEMCPKSFTSLPALKKHIQSVHFNERPFSCDECGKTYKDKDALRKHTLRNHRSDAAVKCAVCAKRFFSGAELDKHCARSHRQSAADTDQLSAAGNVLVK